VGVRGRGRAEAETLCFFSVTFSLPSLFREIFDTVGGRNGRVCVGVVVGVAL
jgi:hypothetical protein